MQDYIDTARIEAELDQKYMELIDKYAPEKHADVPAAKLINRLHCNVWKTEVAFQSQYMTADQAKLRASTLAGVVLGLYREKYCQ